MSIALGGPWRFLYEGIHHIRHPEAIETPYINYIVLSLAMVFEGFALYFAWTEFSRAKGKWSYVEAVHKGKDPTTFVVLFEDSAAILGLLVAFSGVLLSHLTGNYIFDGLASVVIGLILGATAIWLAYETKGLLIGESATHQVVQEIRCIVSKYPEVAHVNEVLTMHMGPNFILANVSVKFHSSITAVDMEERIAEIDLQIKKAFPNVRRVFIEAEARRMQRNA